MCLEGQSRVSAAWTHGGLAFGRKAGLKHRLPTFRTGMEGEPGVICTLTEMLLKNGQCLQPCCRQPIPLRCTRLCFGSCLEAAGTEDTANASQVISSEEAEREHE